MVEVSYFHYREFGIYDNFLYTIGLSFILDRPPKKHILSMLLSIVFNLLHAIVDYILIVLGNQHAKLTHFLLTSMILFGE